MLGSIGSIAVMSFYSFVNISDLNVLFSKILLIGKKKYVKGTILISEEGFNGSISGTLENVQLVVEELIQTTKSVDINVKVNYCESHPFHKLKVKIKKEIIAIGIPELDVQNLKGTYVEPENWDSFIQDPNVVVIDTRNDYEVEVGTFKNAIDPKTKTFKEFPAWVMQNKQLLKDKKIAMYCTGGIRCEKSTSYLKSEGFDEVYHLKGGILQYLEDTKNTHSMWEGKCFVFDDRRELDDDLVSSNV